jgi:Spy/CpxP family protein refolding chaperone
VNSFLSQEIFMKAGKLLLTLAAVGLLGVGSFTLGVRASDTPSTFGLTTQPSDHPLLNFIRGQIGRWMVLRSQLDLTGEQKQQIATILQAHKAEIVEAVKPVVEKRRALREAVIAPVPDEKAIRTAADDLGKSIGDVAVLASHIRQQIAPILTDQQRHEIGDFRSQSDAAVDSFFAKMANGQ